MAQRINGFEQIKGFYSWAFENQDLGVKPQHVSIYLFLVNQNNRNSWVEWFKVPFDLGMAGSCISSKKTYYACIADLQKWNLIQYQPGVNNWKAPLIKLEVLKDTSTVPQSEPQLAPQVLPQHILQLVQQATPQPIHNIKLLTLNLKRVTLNLKQILVFLDETLGEEEGEEKKNVAPENSEEREKQIVEATQVMMKDFKFTGIANPNKQRQISDFIRKLFAESRIEYFIEQYPAYWQYKKLSGLGTQSLDTFINDGWDRENWVEKLKEHNNNGKQSTTPDAKRAGRHEMARKLDDMLKQNTGE